MWRRRMQTPMRSLPLKSTSRRVRNKAAAVYLVISQQCQTNSWKEAINNQSSRHHTLAGTLTQVPVRSRLISSPPECAFFPDHARDQFSRELPQPAPILHPGSNAQKASQQPEWHTHHCSNKRKPSRDAAGSVSRDPSKHSERHSGCDAARHQDLHA